MAENETSDMEGYQTAPEGSGASTPTGDRLARLQADNVSILRILIKSFD